MYFERYQNGAKVKVKYATGLNAPIEQILWFPGDGTSVIDRTMTSDKT
jgi:hypothetical protein